MATTRIPITAQHRIPGGAVTLDLNNVSNAPLQLKAFQPRVQEGQLHPRQVRRSTRRQPAVEPAGERSPTRVPPAIYDSDGEQVAACTCAGYLGSPQVCRRPSRPPGCGSSGPARQSQLHFVSHLYPRGVWYARGQRRIRWKQRQRRPMEISTDSRPARRRTASPAA